MRKWREPLPPVAWLLILLAVAWILVELWLLGIGYMTGTRGPIEKKYANAEDQLWTEAMPLLVTYGKKEVEVEHVVEKWHSHRRARAGELFGQSGSTYKGTFLPFRDPTAEEGEKSPKLRRTGESITIFFPVEPETMKIYRWEAGREDKKTELTAPDGILSLAPGEWIYGVEASWSLMSCKVGSWYGRAWYCFRATGPGSE